MGKANFLTYCDRELSIDVILQYDSSIEVVSQKVITGECVDDTTKKYELRRGRERATVSMIVGDLESQVAPYDGEYWTIVEGEPEGFMKYNEPFARELTEILIANGGRRTRKSNGAIKGDVGDQR